MKKSQHNYRTIGTTNSTSFGSSAVFCSAFAGSGLGLITSESLCYRNEDLETAFNRKYLPEKSRVSLQIDEGYSGQILFHLKLSFYNAIISINDLRFKIRNLSIIQSMLGFSLQTGCSFFCAFAGS